MQSIDLTHASVIPASCLAPT